MSSKRDENDQSGTSNEGRNQRTPSYVEWLMWEAIAGPNTLHPPPEKEVGLDDELIQEVEDYVEADKVEGTARH